MKKLFCIMLTLFLLVGCSPAETTSVIDKQDHITGVWLSYSELDGMLRGDFKAEFDMVMQNCKTRGITDIFVHARPFCDSYYPSQYFPLRESAAMQEFDVFEFMISLCHQNDIKFHAWINPYRVRTADQSIDALSDSSPAKIWLKDQSADNDANVSFADGIYLSPDSSEVRQLVIDGIREILANYSVDGIHFDDYFYPTQDEAFDAQGYSSYCAETQKPLPLSDWRRANVNALISGTYTAIKFKNKDIIFSVSPSASVQENYDRHYADVVAWLSSNCIDYIIPQLYFGFDYPDSNFKFDSLLSDWKTCVVGSEAKLLIGLATYKIGTQNEPDKTEWSNGKEVIKRQTEICQKSNEIYGHIYFSYTSMCEYL